MRNIKKTMMVKEVELKVYDTRDKLEKLIETTVSEVESRAQLPEGCVLISEKVISEKEVVYKMTPQDFVKYATIEK
jgi:hypothetical protein